MDCVILDGHGLLNTPVYPFSMFPENIFDRLIDYVIIFMENQGTVLQTSILTRTDLPEYPQGAGLLVLSGIWPASPATPEGERRFLPQKERNPLRIHEKFISREGFREGLREVAHSGRERKVTTPRTGRFGIIPEAIKEMLAYLKTLRELYDLLKTDAKYMDFAKRLAIIIKGLESFVR